MAELINPSSYNDFTLQSLMTPDGITRLNSILSQLSQNIAGDTETVRVFQGVGTPEASVAAGIGSLYLRTDGSTDTSVYRKESGSGDTGWVAIKAPASLPLSVANGGTGADNSSGAQGSILYFSATGVISILTPGTSGQFLKTQGAAANPTWDTVNQSTPYNTTAPLTTLFSDNRLIQGTGVTHRTAPFFRSGTVSVYFSARAYNGIATGSAYIRKNGTTQVGTTRDISGGTFVTFTEDISISTGDYLELYIATGTNNSEANGFEIRVGNPSQEAPIKGDGTVIVAPVIRFGTGAPAASLGNQGDLYIRLDGGATTTLYVNSGGGTWTAK